MPSETLNASVAGDYSRFLCFCFWLLKKGISRPDWVQICCVAEANPEFLVFLFPLTMCRGYRCTLLFLAWLMSVAF